MRGFPLGNHGKWFRHKVCVDFNHFWYGWFLALTPQPYYSSEWHDKTTDLPLFLSVAFHQRHWERRTSDNESFCIYNELCEHQLTEVIFVMHFLKKNIQAELRNWNSRGHKESPRLALNFFENISLYIGLRQSASLLGEWWQWCIHLCKCLIQRLVQGHHPTNVSQMEDHWGIDTFPTWRASTILVSILSKWMILSHLMTFKCAVFEWLTSEWMNLNSPFKLVHGSIHSFSV